MSATAAGKQVTLPGQAASPPGPVDLAGRFYPHHGFRRDLDSFARVVPQADLSDRPRWRALARRWRYFSLLLQQHTGKDAGWWPLLLERVDAVGDTGARATLDAMTAERGRLEPLLESCRLGFDRLAAAADPDTRAALAVRLVAARQILGDQLARQETDALALVQRHLTEQDWRCFEGGHFAAERSVRESLHALCWVLAGLAEPDQLAFFQQPGVRALRLPWNLLLRRRFERAESRAFG